MLAPKIAYSAQNSADKVMTVGPQLYGLFDYPNCFSGPIFRLVDKFKNRNGIRNLSIQGEELSAAGETVDPFLQKIHKVVEEKGLTPEQICNADDTGLLWKCLLQRTLVSSREKSAPGFKKAKDMVFPLITVLSH